MIDLPSKKILTAEAAGKMISAAETAASKMGKALSIAIVDDGGNLLAFLRMDDAPLASVALAQQKAQSCVGFTMATHELWELIEDDPMAVAGLPASGVGTALGGGYPIVVEDKIVGAIGCSGAHYTEDMDAAKAAVAMLQ